MFNSTKQMMRYIMILLLVLTGCVSQPQQIPNRCDQLWEERKEIVWQGNLNDHDNTDDLLEHNERMIIQCGCADSLGN
jgi:hypothetical protein